MKLSFKKRIAFINTIAVAVTIAIVFMIIYGVVYYTSHKHLDNDILQEKGEITHSLTSKEDSVIINKIPEWEEAEHKKVEVNPTFIQIVDYKDSMIFKSANLKSNHFLFKISNERGYFYNDVIENQRLRLGQFPIWNNNGKVIGQLTIGVSQQESYIILNNLLLTLCISFPVLLVILYVVIYLAASRAIAPVNTLIQTASGFHDSNIKNRLPLPENEDELYQLAITINELLGRIENSVQQQKQFTADASHEIRTPLSAIRGNLEVLLRKHREPVQYEEKIKEVIGQTDRLSQLLDQLLQLARLEAGIAKKEDISLTDIVQETTAKWAKQIAEKKIILHTTIPEDAVVTADHFFLAMMIENLISNAIKYSPVSGNIFCSWDKTTNSLSIINEGTGIARDQIPYIFNRFYRTDESRSSQIPGSGLGLAIVKKLSDLQHIAISVESIPGKTIFSLQFSA